MLVSVPTQHNVICSGFMLICNFSKKYVQFEHVCVCSGYGVCTSVCTSLAISDIGPCHSLSRCFPMFPHPHPLQCTDKFKHMTWLLIDPLEDSFPSWLLSQNWTCSTCIIIELLTWACEHLKVKEKMQVSFCPLKSVS